MMHSLLKHCHQKSVNYCSIVSHLFRPSRIDNLLVVNHFWNQVLCPQRLEQPFQRVYSGTLFTSKWIIAMDCFSHKDLAARPASDKTMKPKRRSLSYFLQRQFYVIIFIAEALWLPRLRNTPISCDCNHCMYWSNREM